MAGFRDCGVRPVDHRAIPHPSVTLLLEFGAEPPVVVDGTGHQESGSLVAGPGFGFGRGAVRVQGKNIECVQVRLSSSVAGAVLGVSPAELDGAVVPLHDLWAREAGRIHERLEHASWEDRFAFVDALLASRCAAGPSVDPEVAWAWDRIVTRRGLVRIESLAAEVGWSRKRLWSRFHAQIGLPPKRAAKLVRFDHAAHRLVAGEDAARVAAESGYADQSHLNRDVLAFAGVTPTAVAAEPWLAVDDVAWPIQARADRSPPRLPLAAGRAAGR